MLPGYLPKEPDSIRAGTTILFERSIPNYPASQGWSLSYSITGLGAQVTFQSVADGDSHAITVPASVTSAWLATNTSKLNGFAVLAGPPQQVFSIYEQSCPILPNLLTPPADQPSATFLQLAIKAHEELFMRKACDDLLVAHVGDSLFRYESKKQVWEMLCMLRAERLIELAKERARNGKPSTRRVIPCVSITPPGPLFGQQWPSDYFTS